METINLTDKEIQSLIDARKVCKDLKEWSTMNCLDDILNDIYPGWISHLKEGY